MEVGVLGYNQVLETLRASLIYLPNDGNGDNDDSEPIMQDELTPWTKTLNTRLMELYVNQTQQ